MVMEQYFKNLRKKIGHEEIIMPGVAGIFLMRRIKKFSCSNVMTAKSAGVLLVVCRI